jgi:hypothetical protein
MCAELDHNSEMRALATHFMFHNEVFETGTNVVVTIQIVGVDVGTLTASEFQFFPYKRFAEAENFSSILPRSKTPVTRNTSVAAR